MSGQNKREAFASLANRFKKHKDKKSFQVRPPYNKDDSLFLKYCLKCVDSPCASMCEEEIIKIDNDKLPYMSFEKSGCTFCAECVEACPADVLVSSEEESINAKFNIDINSCLAWNSVICSSCKDMCNDDAIAFLGVFRPTVDMDKCTGCGFCYGVCPPFAIKYM